MFSSAHALFADVPLLVNVKAVLELLLLVVLLALLLAGVDLAVEVVRRGQLADDGEALLVELEEQGALHLPGPRAVEFALGSHRGFGVFL